MFFLSKLLWLVFKPTNLVLLSLTVGAGLSAWGGGRWRRAGRWLVGLALAAFVVVSVLPLGSWGLRLLEDRFPPPASLPERVGGIVVLGGVFDGALTEARGTLAINGNAERLWYGLALAKRYPDAKLVYSGGNSLVFAEVPTEAEQAEQAYRAAGLTGPRVVYERGARNTRENAVLSMGLVKPGPDETWLLVTSAAHMPRAWGCFDAIGWSVVPFPVDYATGGGGDPIAGFSPLRGLQRLTAATYEFAGLAYYYARGWIASPFPAPPGRAQPSG